LRVVLRYSRGAREWKPLERFARELGLQPEAIAREPVAVAPKRGAPYMEVYDLAATPMPFRRLLGHTLTPGDFIGILEPARSFKPSLLLGALLAGKCGVIKCIRVTGDGERFFLYGKPVYGRRVLEWRPGLAPVLGEDGEFIGWGVGREHKIGGRRLLLVEPVWDLGWYLRRGG